jgi:hypothetical protein
MTLFSFLFKKKIIKQTITKIVYKEPTIYIKKTANSLLHNQLKHYTIRFRGSAYSSDSCWDNEGAYKTILRQMTVEFFSIAPITNNEKRYEKLADELYRSRTKMSDAILNIAMYLPDALNVFNSLNNNSTIKKDEEEFSEKFSYVFSKLKKHELDLQITMGPLYEDLKLLLDEVERKIS